MSVIGNTSPVCVSQNTYASPSNNGKFFSYNANFADNVKLSELYLRCNGASCIMYGNIIRLATLQLLRAGGGEKYEDVTFKITLTSQFSVCSNSN